MRNNILKNRGVIILGASILAAAWMIVGPDVLNKFNLDETAVEILVWMPAMILFFGSISGHKDFIACERRAFKKLLRLR